MDFLGVNAHQQRKKPCDHEALDVVRVAQIERLAERVAQAVELGVAGPKKLGQRLMSSQGVPLEVARHRMPIHAAHIFPPSENLPEKPFGRRQGHSPGAVGVFGRVQDCPRMQQLEIEHGAEAGVVEPGFAHPHGILPTTELRQSMRNEIL